MCSGFKVVVKYPSEAKPSEGWKRGFILFDESGLEFNPVKCRLAAILPKAKLFNRVKVAFFIRKLNKINMAYDSDRGFAPRETVKGNWKCADCGVEITELPFEPAADRPIYCKECWSKRRPKRDFSS